VARAQCVPKLFAWPTALTRALLRPEKTEGRSDDGLYRVARGVRILAFEPRWPAASGSLPTLHWGTRLHQDFVKQGIEILANLDASRRGRRV